MKQFNLEEYLENPDRRIITRDGRNVRIVCTDRKFEFLNVQYPIMALVKDFDNDDVENSFSFTSDGKETYGYDGNTDLFFAPEKKSGWTNVYKYTFGGTHLSEIIYNSKEEAENNAKVYETNINTYITTIKIEWEE